MTGGRGGKHRNKPAGKRPANQRRAWRGTEEDPAPPAHGLNWRRGVGQAISASFSAGAVALRRKLGLNTETNYGDTANAYALGTTLALIDNGPAIPIGATAGTTQRIGREVRVVRYQIKGYVYCPSTSTGVGLARVVAVFNRQQDGQALTAAQVLAANTNIASLSAGDLTDRGGTIVYDKTLKLLSYQGTYATNDEVINTFEFEFSEPDWHLQWPSTDTAGTQAANLGGAIQVYAMHTGIATTSPQLSYYARMEYVDN